MVWCGVVWCATGDIRRACRWLAHLGPVGLELDRLLGVLQGLVKLALRGVAGRAVAEEHVVGGIQLDGLTCRRGGGWGGWLSKARETVKGVGGPRVCACVCV